MREYKSRLSEVENQQSLRSAVIFGGLTIFIILFVIFFGIPIFGKISSLFVKKSNPTITQNITLLPPNLIAPPQHTNQQSIIIKGSTLPNSKVKIFFNNSSDETISDSSGNFAMNITLTKGANIIYGQTIDSNGNISNNSSSFTVNFTNQTPNLTINTPANNQVFYGDSQKTITIQGSTDVNNTVTINDHITVLDTNGKFSLPFNLSEGDNQLKIISADQAGNKKQIDLKVTFNP
jgi:hypothetical protein